MVGGGAPDRGVVVSSRVRLARNLVDHPFPEHAGAEGRRRLRERVEEAAEDLADSSWHGFRVGDLDADQRGVLRERRLASRRLIGRDEGGVWFHADEGRGFLINEEDHLRLQVMRPGCQLAAVHEAVVKLHDTLAERLSFQRHERWGYLTACPTNLGTGLRASVLLHLPGLVLSGGIERVLRAISSLGMVVRGYYGEGTESRGFYVQLSNQVTLGQSAEQLVEGLRRVTERIVGRESRARGALLRDETSDAVDRIWKSYGTLRYARKVASERALERLSLCRLGAERGLIDGLELGRLDGLMMRIQPRHLRLNVGEELSGDARRFYRATLIRKLLGSADPEAAGRRDD